MTDDERDRVDGLALLEHVFQVPDATARDAFEIARDHLGFPAPTSTEPRTWSRREVDVWLERLRTVARQVTK